MQTARTDLELGADLSKRQTIAKRLPQMSTRQCLVLTALAGGAAATSLAFLYYYTRKRREAMG